jgi:hypothetical protein
MLHWTYVQHGNASGHEALTCIKDMPQGQAAGTCNMDMKHGLASWSRSVDMYHGHAAWTCSIDTRHRNSYRPCSMNKQQGHAAWTCIHLTQDPCSPLPLLSGFGLCNRVSSVVRQWKGKARIPAFFLCPWRFLFFALPRSF